MNTTFSPNQEAIACYNRYAKLRDRKGLSDFRVAKDLGIAISTLTDWKAGRYMPKIDKIRKIAELLGVAIGAIYG